jgi:hypothetical protein
MSLYVALVTVLLFVCLSLSIHENLVFVACMHVVIVCACVYAIPGLSMHISYV